MRAHNGPRRLRHSGIASVLASVLAITACAQQSGPSRQPTVTSPSSEQTSPESAQTWSDPSETPQSQEPNGQLRRDYFLSDLPALEVQGSWSPETLTVNGSMLANSLVVSSVGIAARGVRSEAQFNLQRKCSSLNFTAGISDDSPTTSVELMEIYADGQLLDTRHIRFGEALPVKVALNDALRLRLVTTSESQAGHKTVFGSATVKCFGLA